MERAWAIRALRSAIQAETGAEVPWNMVETQLQLSTQRRQDLLRLLRFSAEGQSIVMRYGWSEWTLRPLHMALNAGTISADEATDMLRVLAETPDVTITVVGGLVEAYRQRIAADPDGDPQAQGTVQAARSASTRDGLQRIVRLRRTVEQLRPQLPQAGDRAARKAWRTEIEALRDRLDELLAQL
jgi:hypothetical protein